MKTPQEQGREFERELASEFGLRTTPASGALWFSKLDLAGKNARFSLKYTEKTSFSINQALIDEAVRHCEGPGGDGSIPIWAIRLNNEAYDLMIMRKSDWVSFQQGEIKFTQDVDEKLARRRKLADTPYLLRDEDGSN